MLRILLSCSAALAACAPSPQEATMRSPRSGTAYPRSGKPADAGDRGGAGTTGHAPGDRGPAAPGPLPEPVSATASPAPGRADLPSPDSAAAARGRRILSTAFVMVGPDGQLTVERQDGRMLVLRDVVMRPADYCGVRVTGGSGKARYCGGYAEVAAARPGGGPTPHEPDAAVSPPGAPRRGPVGHR